ncbi:hypothetical protein [Chondrinema litorale]|uniref:hypothetical protein n=1 Tax=Chondrinema litorale TaxID=2994555 RepID=UPI000C3E474D|nr:hypothetical protein [Chondrinema litorale]MBT33399.1 hypothetical protein [Thalassovita sp.]UZR97457.1 hypothetical protein OQ292_26990 [Chondrinema litorale]
MKAEKFVPYSEVSFATVPDKSTKFWRRFWLWQLYRFVVLNLKMMRIVVGGHS